MTMSPGTYLAKRRNAAGLSLEEVAARISAEPPMGHAGRVEWIRSIEQDVAPISSDVMHALDPVYDFDIDVLQDLIDLRGPDPQGIVAPQICEVCGCSEYDPCEDARGRCCSWSSHNLCSACVPAAVAT